GSPQINIYNYGQQCPCYPPSHQPPAQYGGTLTQNGGSGKPIQYTTSGGYNVSIDGHTITIKDPQGKHTVKHWGDPHEEVDGKHIKDWDGKTRSIILGDGTKITMNADSPTGVTKHTSIYDGAQEIQIDNTKNHIEKIGFNPWETARSERAQADGETSYMGFREDGTFVNKDIYWQNDDLSVREYHKDLGSEPPRPKPPRWSDQWAYLNT
ncbi:MAG: DUF1521 domain-containing protein, partial [Armatimonadetes bacterium]|nr:DUF1521 domain-containing protein [Armatimonadota bacterium]